MTTEGKAKRLIAFAGHDHRIVSKRVAGSLPHGKSFRHRYPLSVPLSFHAFQSIMDKRKRALQQSLLTEVTRWMKSR
jgi:hypothetical protein